MPDLRRNALKTAAAKATIGTALVGVGLPAAVYGMWMLFVWNPMSLLVLMGAAWIAFVWIILLQAFDHD